jgi:signal transduction histidine kinase
MPRLVVLEGPDAGLQFELTAGAVTVGRHSSNPIPLTDPRVSRRHFDIRATAAGATELHDLGSGNGTEVNGREVRTVLLRGGDRIGAGDTLLRYEDDGPPSVDRTRLVVRPTEFPSAILRSVAADMGSQILKRPEVAGTDWLRGRLANLAVLYEASEVVSDVLDVETLLTRIVELLVRTTDADHGGAVLIDPDTGAAVPTAVVAKPGADGEFVVSHTVLDHVLKEKLGILVSDATADVRFRAGDSIARHQFREVICVPMKGRHDTVGVIFLDTRASLSAVPVADPVTFTEDHLKLAVAVAHQAALAVEETRYYHAMVQSERLAAVGQTIAALSHHIKNIMQGVRFGSDMVKMGLAEDDRELLTKGWRLVEKNQTRIDELILDMLGYSKEREPAAEPTDLPSLVADVLEVVRGRADDGGVSLDVDADPLPPVPCDPDGIHRAVLNVISNAVDAVTDVPTPRVTVTVRAADGFAEIAVADNGAGVPEDKREDVFKPFVSTKGNRGTGLGLPAARKALREHGGDVVIRDGPSGGAVFVIRLPLHR